MNGPPLTPQEAVASVARRVRRLEAQGLERDWAIQRAAAETGIDAKKVRWCAETARADWTPRRSRWGSGRRTALAIAAAL